MIYGSMYVAPCSKYKACMLKWNVWLRLTTYTLGARDLHKIAVAIVPLANVGKVEVMQLVI